MLVCGLKRDKKTMETRLSQYSQHKRIEFFQEISLQSFKEMMNYSKDLAHLLISDLLTIEGYTEIEISLGSYVHISTIRQITAQQPCNLKQDDIFNLICFYLRVFNRYEKFHEHELSETQ